VPPGREIRDGPLISRNQVPPGLGPSVSPNFLSVRDHPDSGSGSLTGSQLHRRTEIFVVHHEVGVEVGVRLEPVPCKELVSAGGNPTNDKSALGIGRDDTVLIGARTASRLGNENDDGAPRRLSGLVGYRTSNLPAIESQLNLESGRIAPVDSRRSAYFNAFLFLTLQSQRCYRP
jgi:hypothetical protein